MSWERRRGALLLCPHRYCPNGVTEIAPSELVELGIRAVLLDLDNTLVGWQRLDIPTEVRQWLQSLRDAGLQLYLVSNTRYGRRLQALSQRLGIPYVRRAWKPRRRGFRAALQAMGVEPGQTAMIGDQMFTDVLGGNRLGLYTIMVRPLVPREFFGTRLSRAVECRLLSWFRRKGLIQSTGSPRNPAADPGEIGTEAGRQT